ncbi:MAG TPA: hypothetical protein VF696_02005 [Candidatus Paceibacterota bacterium]|jgi:hypothetical protein
MTYQGHNFERVQSTDVNRPTAFSWRDFQPKDLSAIGGPGDHAPHQHKALQEDCEELMDRIAERSRGIDFTKADADPLLAMIAWGKENAVVTPDEAEALQGLYDPKLSRSIH